MLFISHLMTKYCWFKLDGCIWLFGVRGMIHIILSTVFQLSLFANPMNSPLDLWTHVDSHKFNGGFIHSLYGNGWKIRWRMILIISLGLIWTCCYVYCHILPSKSFSCTPTIRPVVLKFLSYENEKTNETTSLIWFDLIWKHYPTQIWAITWESSEYIR